MNGEANLIFGWITMLLGVFAGAGIGLFIHIEDWGGGYASYRRRMLRLAHIAFFGLGFINLFFALTLEQVSLPQINQQIASIGLILGGITMPMVCYLSAWRMSMRHLFPIPVLAVTSALIALLAGWNTT